VFVTAPAHERDAVCRQVIEALTAARDPETGERIVEAAHRREDVYRGDQVSRLPDVLIDFGDRPYLGSDRLAVPSLVERLPPSAGGGRHRRSGIIVAAGPGVSAGDLGAASITDVSPTVLHAMDLPVPEGLDGRVLTELFGDGRPVRYGDGARSEAPGAVEYSDEEAAAIEASLRGIGYL
jgi:predicted AlkP superfamily phosphohydrolase/phosphomutase